MLVIAMTYMQKDFDLLRKLDEADSEAIEELHSYYGIQKVRIAPALDRITVNYDATRLSPADINAVLVRFGVPISL